MNKVYVTYSFPKRALRRAYIGKNEISTSRTQQDGKINHLIIQTDRYTYKCRHIFIIIITFTFLLNIDYSFNNLVEILYPSRAEMK